MRKTYKLPLLVLPLLLSACGPTSTPTTETPTEAPTTVAPTETPTETPTTEVPTEAPTSAPTTDPNAEYLKAVKAEIGTLSLLKTYIADLESESIIRVNFSKSLVSSTTNTETQIEAMYRSEEIYTVETETEHAKEGDEVTKETNYRGIVGGLYYEAVLSTHETFSRVSRSKIAEDGEYYQKDIISEADALTDLNNLMDSYRLNCLSEYGFWNDVLDNSKFKLTSYDITADDLGARAVLKGYSESWSSCVYTLILNFDTDIKLISGTLNTDKYSSDNWNNDSHTPIDALNTTSKAKVSLDGVEYGEPLKTRDETMVDLSNYYVSSLTPDVYINNFVSDPSNGRTIFSEPNEVYPNRPIDAPNDYIRENKAYLPETALDSDNLYITGASIEGFLTLDAYGWNVTGDVGDVAEIYIGNCFNEKIAAIEVTVVKSPVKNNPMISPYVYVVEGEGYEWVEDDTLWRPQLLITGDETLIMAISTSNKAPFDSLPVGFYSFTDGVVSAELVEDQEYYWENYSDTAIYFELTPVASGSTGFAIIDPSTNEGYFEIDITVE